MWKKMLAVCLALFLTAASLPALAGETEAFAAAYMRDLMSGTKTAELYALFTGEVKAQLSQAAFSAVWPQLAAMAGAFDGFGECTVREVSGYTVCSQRLDMERTDLVMQLTLDKAGRVAGLNFTVAAAGETPAPAKIERPQGITEEAVTVGAGEWALPGTLTLPARGEGFPAVVLVQGSGPHDRDETIGQTKLFRDLAWFLAQRGIAVLRYDKRTFVHADKLARDRLADFTVEEETVEDAILAARLLGRDSRVNKQKIFLAGHSLGAMLGPRIARESGGLFAGMLLLSGTPLPFTDIIIAQNEAVLAKLPEEARAAHRPLLDAEVEKLDALLKGSAEEARGAQVFGLPGYYLYEMLQWDPAALLLEMRLPAFLLQGGKDFQVSVENGLAAWQKAVGEQGFVTYTLYPELNHLMMRYTGDPALQFSVQEYDTPASLNEAAAADMINWILSH